MITKNRFKKILFLLKEADDYIPTAKIAKKINVSDKTIRRDLLKIEKMISKHKAKIIKKPGKGIKISLYQTDNTGLWESLNIKDNKKIISAETRHKMMIHKIISQDNINQEYILNKFNISISTFYSDLKKIEKILKKYDLRLETANKEEYMIIGNELNLRVLMTNNIINLLSKDDKNDIIYLLNNNVAMLTDEIIYLKECCPGLELKEFRQAAAIIEERTDIDFNSNFLLYFIIYSAVSFNRIKYNNYLDIKLNIQNYSYLKNRKSYIIAKKIVKEIEKRFEIKLNDNEIFAYLIQIWINGSILDNSRFSPDDFISKITATSNIIIDLFKKDLNIRQNNKNEIILNLNIYLRSLLIQRRFKLPSKYKLKISEFEIKMLKSRHPYIFTLAEGVIKIIENNLDITITKNEINYIAIIFLAELEKQKNNLKILIIHDNSNPIINLMLLRLNKYFFTCKFELLKYSKVFNIDKQKLDDYDLYLSTKAFEEFPYTLVISPILSSIDIKKIKNKIKILRDLEQYK
jgi:transcriptional antiterminator